MPLIKSKFTKGSKLICSTYICLLNKFNYYMQVIFLMQVISFNDNLIDKWLRYGV